MNTLFIDRYFNAERLESLMFVGIGIVTLILGLYFLLSVKKSFYSGMAWPFLLIALIQITVGSIIFLRSPKDAIRVKSFAQSEVQKIETEEVPRMVKVMDSFKVYKYVEIALIITSILIILFSQYASLLKGIGVGLFLQASMMLAADLFAEERGSKYLNELRTSIASVK